MKVGVICPECNGYNDVILKPLGDGSYEETQFKCRNCGRVFSIAVDRQCNIVFEELHNTAADNSI